MFEWFKSTDKSSVREAEWTRGLSADGLVVVHGTSAGMQQAIRLNSVGLAPLFKQLDDEGIAIPVDQGWLIPWDQLYSFLDQHGPGTAAIALSVPPLGPYAPVLVSNGSLTDTLFTIQVVGWHDGSGRLVDDVELFGPVIRTGESLTLMSRESWATLGYVDQFRNAFADQRTAKDNRVAWARIRQSALAANARLDDFLFRSVVLSPEKLEIGLRKAQVGGSTVVEVAPSFAGAPNDWLGTFDRFSTVQERYDIPTAEGIVQVLLSSPVRAVLQQIKRMPGRRVAGSRAEAFIANPFAALGEDAVNAIDADQFEKERERAGLIPETFVANVERDAFGYPEKVGLTITTSKGEETSDEIYPFDRDDQILGFIELVEKKLSSGLQFCGWEGYDLELMGDTTEQLQLLRTALGERAKPRVQISYAQVHDLSRYAERVESIGVEKPYYSPFIARKNEEEGWFPENVIPVICWTLEDGAEPVALPITKEIQEQIRNKLEQAKQSGQSSFALQGIDKAIPVSEAEQILATFDAALGDVKRGEFDPEKVKSKTGTSRLTTRLIGRANIQSVDYEEARRELLLALPPNPRMPLSLRPDVKLKDHQLAGLAWLRHLFDLSPERCRGAVLADDMGLGKTLQLLCLIAALAEETPDQPPALVVAPLSLLENWAEEVARFFKADALPMLTAYGPNIARLKLPRESIDERLRGDGLINFLRPGWRGDAKIVLTTYETLRDMEFSFAAEKWSIMVCDEAQRIKNPNAMVTRAAKKQNVQFRVACTGTPVENTLADLWCLFDFVQPGLLGALNDFGRRYRRPIEAETEEEKARVEELRTKIKPQILRRMKEDVAKDLPNKTLVDDCRRLPLSTHQRSLYANAIDLFKKRNEPAIRTPFKNHLGLLHYLRLICTDPRRHGLEVFRPEPLSEYELKAPKLQWLIATLEQIKLRKEKAIVFCEFKNIQRLLAHYIEQTFGFIPDIINGDTTAAATHIASRQKRIKAFQASPGFGVIILSPQAVGFGVNIQEANHVIHYTRTWNPAKEDQATDRAYRIGQQREVFVYCPVVYADDFTTFDVKLDQLLSRKRELARDMLNGAGDVGPNEFVVDEVIPGGDALFSERIVIDDVLQMQWDYFECFVAALWSKMGYRRVYRTPITDDGVDVVAINGREGVLVQCKSSGSDTDLGWDAVKDVVTGAASYQLRHPGVSFTKVCVTNQFFNATAERHASLNSVVLHDQKKLTELLETYSVRMPDIEQFLVTEWGAVA
jgi:hypothetical protein